MTVLRALDGNGLAPEAERLLIDAMGWRTLQQQKARALINSVTLPALLDQARRKDAKALLALRNDANTALSLKARSMPFSRGSPG